MQASLGRLLRDDPLQSIAANVGFLNALRVPADEPPDREFLKSDRSAIAHEGPEHWIVVTSAEEANGIMGSGFRDMNANVIDLYIGFSVRVA